MTSTATQPQHLQALAEANRIRSLGAAFKRECSALGFREGRALLAAYLEKPEPPEEVGYMTVEEFLRAGHRNGTHRAREFLNRAEVVPSRLNKRIRDLTQGERERLAAVLRGVGE